MKKSYNLGKFGLTAFVFLLLGYLGKIAIYPCKWAPVVLNPVYKWKLCSMDLLARRFIVGVHELYFGFNQGKIIALVLNLVIAWLIVSLIIYICTKLKKNEHKRISKKRK